MRQEKQLLLDELQDLIENSTAFVLTKHEGFKANQANEFRCLLRESGAQLEMVRKRVFMKAAAAAGVDGIQRKALEGSIGIVFATGDTVTATKAVVKYAEDSGQAITILGGHFDGKMLNAQEVETLSKLPSMDEMRAQLLATFQAPAQQTLAVMQTLLTSPLYLLENKIEKESGE